LRLTVVAGTVGKYKIQAKYGSTEDHITLQQSTREINKLLPAAQVVYVTEAGYSEELGGAASKEIEIGPDPVSLDPLLLGVPRGATINGFAPKPHVVRQQAENMQERVAVVAVLVTVVKCGPGGDSEVLLEQTSDGGVSADGLSLVLWREIVAPPQFKEMDVTVTGGAPVVNMLLPAPACIFGIEAELRKRQGWEDEQGPPNKCDNWLCATPKWDYNKERIAIPVLPVGVETASPPRFGYVKVEVRSTPEASPGTVTEERLPQGLYILRVRGFSLAGKSAWSRVHQFEVL